MSQAESGATAIMGQMAEALSKMLVQFTRSPSTLKDSEARGAAHAALKACFAHMEGECRIEVWQGEPAQRPVMTWASLLVPELVLGRSYVTIGGEFVRLVAIANPGAEHETMADEQGRHRYSRCHSRGVGRLAGCPSGDPGNIAFTAPAEQLADMGIPIQEARP